ncbi:hypothetical protein HRE53_29670 (plasmid) [Acaryochloris sp. 'Moss Beach']|uniref:hypothetical protein n=1 Tax=Acaryochloris sp. 'Moss Beach' TaxID=2740837 RepID=UPI001F2799AE|nr:hypothetical protein [Acaryochloris sp. 'Moss Beach']UJB72782.1 hypothetical protein HRE53_29670 [Acaryochloris sp. 'Moss Beach']
MAIPGYNDLGYPVQPQPDIPVTLQDQRTGQKTTIPMSANGPIPQQGTDFNNGLNQGRVVKGPMNS